MNKSEIIERLKNIAGYAVHTVGEEPFVMSLDDGIAVHEAIELLEKPETNYSEIPNKWIPVSERLPEEEGHYLVTDDSGGEKWVDSSVFLRSDDGSVYWDFVNVTAWMNLPEPWEGD